MAIRLTSTAPAVGLFSVTKIVLPAFGIIVIALGIYNSMTNFTKAEKYKRAERRYRQQRSEADRS